MASLSSRLTDLVAAIATKFNLLDSVKENAANKVTDLTVYDDTTYPTTAAVKSVTDPLDSALNGLALQLSDKVDKVSGRGLSQENYTTTEKNKLAAISGTNTGDETTATIKSKLSISTLSGSNTGDQYVFDGGTP